MTQQLVLLAFGWRSFAELFGFRDSPIAEDAGDSQHWLRRKNHNMPRSGSNPSTLGQAVTVTFTASVLAAAAFLTRQMLFICALSRIGSSPATKLSIVRRRRLLLSGSEN
jgi:hypothetical protein